jgi:hypothetical protein
MAGCDSIVTPTGEDEEQPDAATFSGRSLPEVVLDASITVDERRYLTGSVPVAISTNTFDQAERIRGFVETASGYHDCFVARPRMDWVEFGPRGGRRLNADMVASINLSRERGVDCLAVEIDPVSDRREVGILPPELAGKNFSDRDVTEPILEMALDIAERLRPTYLSIGVEMNGYYEAHPVDYLNYVELHKETYDAVKSTVPDVQFYAAFNLEGMQGFFGDLDEFSNHGPQWFLIDMLEPKLDAVAFSTLPFPLFIRPVLIPHDYLSRIELHTSRDILFTEIGWPGDPNAPAHTPASQAEYLAEMVRLIDPMTQVRLVVWTSFFDPDLGDPDDLNEDFANLGLIDTQGNHKPALGLWEQLHKLPYRPRRP